MSALKVTGVTLATTVAELMSAAQAGVGTPTAPPTTRGLMSTIPATTRGLMTTMPATTRGLMTTMPATTRGSTPTSLPMTRPPPPPPPTTTATKALATATAAAVAKEAAVALAPSGCPSNYLPGSVPNPDITPVYDGASTGDGYKVTGNENYYIKPPSVVPAPGSSPTAGGAVGWNVCVYGEDLPRAINAKVKAHSMDNAPGGFQSFKFSPNLPGLFGNHTFNFAFSPTKPLAGGRRGRGSKRGRKGTRRH